MAVHLIEVYALLIEGITDDSITEKLYFKDFLQMVTYSHQLLDEFFEKGLRFKKDYKITPLRIWMPSEDYEKLKRVRDGVFSLDKDPKEMEAVCPVDLT